MSAQAVTLRALVIEDIAREADRRGHRAAARLLRIVGVGAGVGAEDLAVAASDLRARSAQAAALAMLATGTVHAAGKAADILADECGLSGEEWIAETCREQGVEVSA